MQGRGFFRFPVNEHSSSLGTDVVNNMQSNALFITSESEKPEPWSSRWVLRRIQEKGRLTALKDLKTFTHKTRREEISPEVVKAIKEASP